MDKSSKLGRPKKKITPKVVEKKKAAIHKEPKKAKHVETEEAFTSNIIDEGELMLAQALKIEKPEVKDLPARCRIELERECVTKKKREHKIAKLERSLTNSKVVYTRTLESAVRKLRKLAKEWDRTDKKLKVVQALDGDEDAIKRVQADSVVRRAWARRHRILASSEGQKRKRSSTSAPSDVPKTKKTKKTDVADDAAKAVDITTVTPAEEAPK